MTQTPPVETPAVETPAVEEPVVEEPVVEEPVVASPTDGSPAGTAAKKPKKTAKEIMLGMVDRYGPIAMVVWFGIFFSSIGGFVAAMELGVDIDGFVHWMIRTFGLDEARWAGITSGTGKLVVAYGLTQLIKPARIALFVVLTPVVARLTGRTTNSEDP